MTLIDQVKLFSVTICSFTFDLYLNFKLSLVVPWMIECFKICNYCRESCALLKLNCGTILKTAFSLKKRSFSPFVNKTDDSVKSKGHLT